MKRPGFVRSLRSRLPDPAFEACLVLIYALGSIATGVLFAVIYQALTGTLWGMAL